MQAIIFSILNPLAFQPHLLNISSLSSAITSSQFIVFFSTWNENGICSALWPHFPPILMGQRMRNDGISNVVLYDADFWSVEQQELPWPGKKDPQKRNVSPLLPAPFRLYWSVECVIPLRPCPTLPNRSKKKRDEEVRCIFGETYLGLLLFCFGISWSKENRNPFAFLWFRRSCQVGI